MEVLRILFSVGYELFLLPRLPWLYGFLHMETGECLAMAPARRLAYFFSTFRHSSSSSFSLFSLALRSRQEILRRSRPHLQNEKITGSVSSPSSRLSRSPVSPYVCLPLPVSVYLYLSACGHCCMYLHVPVCLGLSVRKAGAKGLGFSLSKSSLLALLSLPCLSSPLPSSYPSWVTPLPCS